MKMSEHQAQHAAARQAALICSGCPITSSETTLKESQHVGNFGGYQALIRVYISMGRVHLAEGSAKGWEDSTVREFSRRLTWPMGYPKAGASEAPAAEMRAGGWVFDGSF